MNFTTTLYNSLIMFFYIIPAYILVKLRIAFAEHGKTISAFLINICAPCMLINSLQNMTLTSDNTIKMFKYFGASIVLQLIGVLILALIFYKKLDDPNYRILLATGICGNVGFFGLPLISSIFPEENIVKCYSCFHTAALCIFIYTAAAYAITKDKKYISFQKGFLNPTVLGLVVGIILYFVEWKLPKELSNAVEILGKATTPLCMFMLGMRLATVELLSLFKRPLMYLSLVIKLAIYPLFCYGCVYFLPFYDDISKYSILILFGTPTAALCLAMAELIGEGQELTSNAILVSQIICVVTLPVLSLLIDV